MANMAILIWKRGNRSTSHQGVSAIIEPELRGLIEKFRPFYDPERIAALGLSLSRP